MTHRTAPLAAATVELLEPRLLMSSGALIVTNASLASAFAPVAEWYTRKGYPASVVTLDAISAMYTGRDLQEQLRNCIRDFHDNHGVDYVLLGGDNTIVPDRDTRVVVSSYVESTMPTDLYYASLSGTWDADGDGIFGEAIVDGVNLAYDVMVARYPIRTAAHVQTLFNKVLAYELNPPTANWATEMLSTGTELWSSYGPGTYNGITYDRTVSDAEIKGRTADALYVQPYWNERTLDVLYDTATSWDAAVAGDYTLTASNLLSAMTNGYQFMHMATHGSTFAWGMESGSSFSSSSLNTTPGLADVAIITTIACNTGGFDAGDACLSEAFLRSENASTIVYLGCSRYGWGYYGGSLGPSFRYSYQFYQEFLQNNRRLAADAFMASKEAFELVSRYEGAYRWVQFGLNFQGDPLIQMYRTDPTALAPLFNGWISEGAQTYTVSNLPAGARVCLWQGDSVYEVGSAGANGVYEATIAPGTGTMRVTIVAPDAPVYLADVNVIEPPTVERSSPAGQAMETMFDPTFYLARHTAAAAAVAAGTYADAFEYYLRAGIRQGHSPSGLFDEGYYLRTNPDIAAVVAAGELASGFEHFAQYGLREGRSSLGIFDAAFYLRANPDVLAAVAGGTFRSAFEHFACFGVRENRSPSLFFDPQYYAQHSGEALGTLSGGTLSADGWSSTLEHYLDVGRWENRNPSAWFDATYYVQQNPDVAAGVAAGAVPTVFDHFVLWGQTEGRDPLAIFQQAYYLQQNPDVAAACQAGMFRSAYEHFLLFGIHEQRAFAPNYDESLYLTSNPDVAAAVAQQQVGSGMEHFLTFGRLEGRTVSTAPTVVDVALPAGGPDLLANPGDSSLPSGGSPAIPAAVLPADVLALDDALLMPLGECPGGSADAGWTGPGEPEAVFDALAASPALAA